MVEQAEIRLARPEEEKDLIAFISQSVDDSVYALAEAYGRSAFSNDFRRPMFLIAQQDNEIIGSASITEELFTIETWGIGWVYVRPDKQRQGLGQRLMEACFDQIRQLTQKSIYVILRTYPGKTGLYDRLGFEKTWQDQVGGWYMMKVLEAHRQNSSNS